MSPHLPQSKTSPIGPGRRVEPEWLDVLPHDHPEARRSRRDIRLLNRLMGNFRAMRRLLDGSVHSSDRILEIGAGEGALARFLEPHRVDALDRCPPPPDWPVGQAWHRTCLLGFEGFSHYTVLIGNLILHHFPDAALMEWAGRLPASIRLMVFNEPRRSAWHLRQLSFAPLLGLNRVTRHDARVSICSGFRGRELVEFLGGQRADWSVRIEENWLGRHTVRMERR